MNMRKVSQRIKLKFIAKKQYPIELRPIIIINSAGIMNDYNSDLIKIGKLLVLHKKPA